MPGGDTLNLPLEEWWADKAWPSTVLLARSRETHTPQPQFHSLIQHCTEQNSTQPVSKNKNRLTFVAGAAPYIHRASKGLLPVSVLSLDS